MQKDYLDRCQNRTNSLTEVIIFEQWLNRSALRTDKEAREQKPLRQFISHIEDPRVNKYYFKYIYF